MKGRPVVWSAAELAWIEARATGNRRATHAGFVAAFDRRDVSLSAINALCKRRGWLTGRTGRFAPGQTPPNKGRKGFCAPGSEKGWFPPGTRLGRAAANYQPIGAERVTKDGYRQRKVNDDLPFQRRWKMVHLIEWEAVNGPLPAGHALKCLDGNRLNTAAPNWVAVPRGLLPRLAGRHRRAFDTAPPDLKPTLLAVARLEHAARAARKEHPHAD